MILSSIFITILLIALYLVLKKLFFSVKIRSYLPYEIKDKLKTTNDLILLDVRTIPEHKSQSIKGSLHIPLQELDRRNSELNKYKNKVIICYCQSGNRSRIAAVKLKKFGFNSANLGGGIKNWNFN
ncbi:MAG: rhodanese-like domain-containing protein [Ignavibacteriaceae bacterium]|jgi:rhodanese-related sulfurtransferase